jgi:hypothetical protein
MRSPPAHFMGDEGAGKSNSRPAFAGLPVFL